MDRIQIEPDLSLKQIHKDNAALFIKLINRNRNYLREWLGWLDVTKTEADVLWYFDSTLKEISEKKALCYLVWEKDSIVGIIHLRDIDYSNKKAMIGYWVGEEFRGRGLCKKATKAIIKTAFETLNLNRIEIRCATKNLASQAIPKSLGFKQEGILRDNEWLYDHYVDHIVFSVLASEWNF